MSNLESFAPSLKRPLVRWPNAPNLAARYDDLREGFHRGTDSVVEFCKGYLETVAITITKELGKTPPTNGSLTEYVKAARDALGIEQAPGASQISKVLSSHNRMADALNALRNQEGTVAHGKDGYLDQMSEYHRRVYLLTADTIVSLLMEAYEGTQPSIRYTRDPHERFDHLNKRLNQNMSVATNVDDDDGSILLTFGGGERLEKFTLRFPPSQLLFDLDREAYLAALEAMPGSPEIEPETDSETETPTELIAAPMGEPEQEPLLEAEPTPSPAAKPDTGRIALGALIQAEPEDAGDLEPYTERLFNFLFHDQGLQAEISANDTLTLARKTLLGFGRLKSPDWDKKASTQSRIRIFIKKTLKSIDVSGDDVEQVTSAITHWLADHFAATDDDA
jgi:hypothetical protein